MSLPPIFIEFIGSYAGLKMAADGVKSELAEVDAEGAASLEGLGAVGTGVMLGLGGAVLGVAYESLKMASTFQSTMEQLHTQANVPQAAIASLGNQVLSLAGQVGFDPDSLAEALYHIESSFASVGISGSEAMDLLKTAANGAAVGHADLVDVTNALDAAVASGIPGVQNFSQAMGALNAIVGSGDMQMQDLANALGTGVLAVVKGYGLSLNDVGAALATFGDNNIRGASAATDLRMAVQALAVPAKAGAGELAKLGFTQESLANDMRKGGLQLALNDLMTHMQKAGVGADQMGDVLTTVFGKKAGVGLSVLMQQLDRFNSKYPELQKGANTFDGAVASNNATLQQHIKDTEASLESLGVRLGTAILPFATKAMGDISSLLAYLTSHTSVLKEFAAGIGAVASMFLLKAIPAVISFSATLLASPLTWIVGIVFALGMAIYYAYEHSKTFRDAVQDIARKLESLAKTVLNFVEHSKTFHKVLEDIGHALMEAAKWVLNFVEHSKTLHKVIADIAGFIEDVWVDSWHAAGAVVNWFVNGPIAFVKGIIADFTVFWRAHGQELEQVLKGVFSTIGTVIEFYAKFIWNLIQGLMVIIEAIWNVVWGAIVDLVKLVWNTIAAIIRAGVKVILDIVGLFLDLITGKWSKLGHDLGQLLSDALHGMANILNTFTQDALNFLWDAGANIIKGLVNGIKAGFHFITDTMHDAGKLVTNSFHDIMSIFSPSRVMYQSGQYVIAGLVNSLKDGLPQLATAAQNMGLSIQGGFQNGPKLTAQTMVGSGGIGTAAGGGQQVIYNVVNQEVQGTVRADHDLRDLILQELLRLGGRNIATWAPAKI